MFSFITQTMFWNEGYTILLSLMFITLLSYILYKPLYYLSLLFFIFCLWFFRSPIRECPSLAYDRYALVSPADGKIVQIQYENVGYGFDQKITILLSIVDAHVMWIPMHGVISHINYKEAAHLFSWLPKSSELNEHNDVYLTVDNGYFIMIRQIAGFLARRISCWVHENQKVQTGQIYGMICFGSQVELFLPKDVTIAVGLGQKVYGGETIIARCSM